VAAFEKRGSGDVPAGVSRDGKLALLATAATAPAAHCVVADDHHQAWVCDPGHGQLLLVDDTLPAIH
jgi:hypothetical protein